MVLRGAVSAFPVSTYLRPPATCDPSVCGNTDLLTQTQRPWYSYQMQMETGLSLWVAKEQRGTGVRSLTLAHESGGSELGFSQMTLISRKTNWEWVKFYTHVLTQ